MVSLDIFKLHKRNYTLESVSRVCKQEKRIAKLLEKLSKNSALVEVIEHFLNFESLYNFFFMSNILNQNGTALGETLVGSNSDPVKITLRGLYYFKITLPFMQILEKHPVIPFHSLCHMQ